MKSFLTLSLALLVFAASPVPAHAVLPPDLVFSAGVQLVQFFAIFAIAIGSVLSGGVVFFRRSLLLSARHAWLVVAVLLFIVLLAVSAVYVVDANEQRAAYQAHLTLLEDGQVALQEQCLSQVYVSEAGVCDLIPGPHASGTVEELYPTNRAFVSDTVTLYSKELAEPFVLEVDFNRRQDAPGAFSQYTFLNGTVFGRWFADYTSVHTPTFTIEPSTFIESFSRTVHTDYSTRDAYVGTLEVKGKPLQFTINNTVGDFITRSDPSYMRHHSVGSAEVAYDGQTFTAQALVEAVYSDDYSKYIFYDTLDDTVAITHQFILWDTEDNFYMIDQSTVSSDTPEYPSHAWFLYKDKASGSTQKRFDLDVTTMEHERDDMEWLVEVPSFKNTSITLRSDSSYKNNENKRKRYTVTGTLTDEAGSRAVRGIAHVVGG